MFLSFKKDIKELIAKDARKRYKRSKPLSWDEYIKSISWYNLKNKYGLVESDDTRSLWDSAIESLKNTPKKV